MVSTSSGPAEVRRSNWKMKTRINFIEMALRAVLVALSMCASAAAAGDDDDELVVDPQQLANQQLWVLTPEQFDQWVFNGIGNYDQAMKQLETQINMRIEAINRVCKLSDAQKQKLRVAAASDIKRFRDKYDEMKLKL